MENTFAIHWPSSDGFEHFDWFVDVVREWSTDGPLTVPGRSTDGHWPSVDCSHPWGTHGAPTGHPHRPKYRIRTFLLLVKNLAQAQNPAWFDDLFLQTRKAYKKAAQGSDCRSGQMWVSHHADFSEIASQHWNCHGEFYHSWSGAWGGTLQQLLNISRFFFSSNFQLWERTFLASWG